MKNLIALFCFSVCSLSTQAVEIEIEAPVYGGSGCEEADAEFFFSPKYRSVRISLNNYLSKDGKRQSCMLVLPTKWAANTKIAVSGVKITGTQKLEARGSGVFQAEVFYPGSHSQPIHRVFEAASERDFNHWLSIDPNKRLWSPCGGDGSLNLRVNTSLLSSWGVLKINQMRVRLSSKPC